MNKLNFREWPTLKLSNILKPISRKVDVEPAKDYDLIGVRWYNAGAHIHQTLSGDNISTRVLTQIREDDIIYNKMWITKNAFAVAKKEHDGAFGTMEYPQFRALPDKLVPKFIEYLFHNPRFQYDAHRLCKGTTGRARLNPSDYLKLEAKIPPLPEQRVIAEILSTWDEAIAKTEQLIAALQVRKKGLMQRLLTGEVRFSGFVQTDEMQETKFGNFPADWQMKKVNQIGKVNADTLSNDGSGKEYSYVELSAVNEGNITFTTEAIAYDDLPSRARRIPHLHDVVMATVRPNLLGYATWDNDLPNHLVSTGFALISPQSLADKDFIYQSLYGDVVQRQIHCLVTGSNYPAINSTEVKNLYLYWPKNPDERKKIGQLFRTIDDEINLHTQKLTILQQQKKGLMQRLLTGEVRVKVDDEVGRTSSEVRPT